MSRLFLVCCTCLSLALACSSEDEPEPVLPQKLPFEVTHHFNYQGIGTIKIRYDSAKIGPVDIQRP